jgi:outer membrane protein OmpA-like peptidoglycan-associated protein
MTPYRIGEEYDLGASQSEEQTGFQVGAKIYADELTAIPFLLNVYYDLGRASVRPEAIPELRKLFQLLEDNPAIVMEIGSHTDSRGSADYNRRLSQRRANAIVQWLVSKGIDRDRLQGRGYGEERPVNNCIDGADCSEEEHQMNRRTEFRVVGEKLGQN